MLVVVKKPHIEIRSRGRLPVGLYRFIKDNYDAVEVDENEAVPFEDSEWFKTLETTPGEMIVANRDLRGWSQVTLAEKIGISVQNLCAMENGRRTVSRKMAAKLGEIFGTDPAAFFDFSAGEKKVKGTSKNCFG